MTVYFPLFSSPSIAWWHKKKLEITMFVIIVSKKHQTIQQYKKQRKKSNKKIFLMTSAFFMMSSIWTIICTSNSTCEFFNEENQLQSYEMINISVAIILSLQKKCWHCTSIFYNLQSKCITKLITSTFRLA